ncbi:single-stranded DNA-binding protein [Qaidamihabitans albus]|uniref:single-stranded DNA-binding protein n=1 Tax=Qaidamihabitans albus TaxID=2795733 RepID=UPI0018F14451|nr:single-stranded DNA-binding protein [Qaidamihabitans albus]
MAIGETLVTVVGNVSSDVSQRTVANGDEVVSFWVRSNERRFDKESERWRDGRGLSVRVTCWRRMAATVGASLSNGDPVIVSGRLYTSRFESDGQPRVVSELEALAIGPNLSWCTATVRRLTRKSSGAGSTARWDGGGPVNTGLGGEVTPGERDRVPAA